MLKSTEFFLPGPTFSWRETRRKHKGLCPVRGHCTRTYESQHPETKGNREQIVYVYLKGKKVPRIMPSKRTQSAEAALVLALQSLPGRPGTPWEGDVRLDVTFVFKPADSWPKWKRELCLLNSSCIRPTGHNIGDRGQYLKMIEDGLEGAGYYTDDCHVNCGNVAKAWGPVPGYWVQLAQLEAGPTSAVEARSLLSLFP